jgi:uncharacterized protein (TIGR04255 family)
MLRFPPQQDIRLQNAPLTEVVCQVRFPPILRIASEHPVEFQEQIRSGFPQLEVEQGIKVQMAPLGTTPPQAQPEPRVFRFRSPDGNTLVSLALDFYALSTTAYTHWSDFLDFLLLANRAARKTYKIPYATRIGLRYINQLTPENTKSGDVAEMLDTLRPELTTLLRVEAWDEPLETFSQLVLAGEEDERLTLRAGFKGQDAPVFRLDFDCYSEGQIALDNLPSLCDRFHGVIYKAFRWCIREERLAVFGPVPVPCEA